MAYAKNLLDVAGSAAGKRGHGPALARHLSKRLARLSARRSPARGATWLIPSLMLALSSVSGARAGSGEGDEVVRALAEQSTLELAELSRPGLPLQAGGVRAVVVIRQDGSVAVAERMELPSTGPGFPAPGKLPASADEERPLDVVQVRIEMVPDSGGAPRPRYSVLGRSFGELDEAAKALERALASIAVQDRRVTVYSSPAAPFGAVARAMDALQPAVSGAQVTHGGIPMDVGEGARVSSEMARLEELEGDGKGDVLLVTDARAPWSSHAQVMQILGARSVARLATVGLHKGELTKVSMYLPVDRAVR